MKIAIPSSEPRSSAGSYVVNFSAICITPFLCQAFCCLNVLCLCALIAAAQQDDDGVAPLLKVDSKARSMIDSQLTDALPHRLHIPCMSKSRSEEHTSEL